MPSTITRLVNATPETRDGVTGMALEWDESPLSPTWLDTAAFEQMRSANRFVAEHRDAIDAAVAA